MSKVSDLALQVKVRCDVVTSALKQAAHQRLHEVAVNLAGEEGAVTLEYVLMAGIAVGLVVAVMIILGNAIVRRARITSHRINTVPSSGSW